MEMVPKNKWRIYNASDFEKLVVDRWNGGGGVIRYKNDIFKYCRTGVYKWYAGPKYFKEEKVGESRKFDNKDLFAPYYKVYITNLSEWAYISIEEFKNVYPDIEELPSTCIESTSSTIDKKFSKNDIVRKLFLEVIKDEYDGEKVERVLDDLDSNSIHFNILSSYNVTEEQICKLFGLFLCDLQLENVKAIVTESSVYKWISTHENVINTIIGE